MAYNQRELAFTNQQKYSKILIFIGFAFSYVLRSVYTYDGRLGGLAFAGQILVLLIFVESMLGVLYISFFYLSAMKKY
jgi:hypothetical protein